MPLSTLKQYYTLAKSVSRTSGKTVLGQLIECLGLYAGTGKISPSEYYEYRLFDDQALSADEKKEFVGWRFAAELDRVLNYPTYHVVSSDKLLFYNIIGGLNLPCPRIYAAVHPNGRLGLGARSITSQPELVRFIRDEITFPFFSKPVQGSFGAGSCLVDEYDRVGDELVLADGKRIPLGEFAEACFRKSPDGRRLPGQILQEALKVHPAIHAKCGPNISGLRLIVLMTESGPKLFRAVWKVTVGNNYVDNFKGGEFGNLLGDVCVDTGRVKNVIAGTGLDRKTVHKHPDTGEDLTDFVLPDWREAVDLCLSASTITPTLRFQHWDVALSCDGPRLLELNFDGSVDLPQLAGHKGIFDSQFRDAFNMDEKAQPRERSVANAASPATGATLRQPPSGT